MSESQSAALLEAAARWPLLTLLVALCSFLLRNEIRRLLERFGKAARSGSHSAVPHPIPVMTSGAYRDDPAIREILELLHAETTAHAVMSRDIERIAQHQERLEEAQERLTDAVNRFALSRRGDPP